MIFITSSGFVGRKTNESTKEPLRYDLMFVVAAGISLAILSPTFTKKSLKRSTISQGLVTLGGVKA